MASQDDPNVQTDPKAPADSQPSTSAAQDALPSTPAECSSWIPTQDMIDITLSTTHASTNQEAIEILRDWRLQQFCLKCGHLFPNRSSRSRRHRCIPSVQSQPVQTQDSNDTPVSIGGFTSVVQGVKDSDHSLSAGQIVGRGQQLQHLDDRTQAVQRLSLSPNTAASALDSLMALPKLRNVEFKIVLSGETAKIHVRTVSTVPVEWNIRNRCVTFRSMSTKDYPNVIAQYGVVPLLERFPIAPESVPVNMAWFRNAASQLALRSHPTIRIGLRHPYSGWLDDEAVLFAVITTCNILGTDRVQTVRIPIYHDTISGSDVPSDRHGDRIDWISTEGAWVDESRIDGPEMKLAKYLTATFDGSLATAGEIQVQASAVIERCSGRRAHAVEAFSRLGKGSKKMYAVDDLKPWYVKVFGSSVSIHLRMLINVNTEEYISQIDCPSDDYRVIVEILTAMTTELLTGGDFYAIFRAGSTTANQMSTLMAEGGMPPIRKPCGQDQPDTHFHVCVGCFDSLPCSEFREPGLGELRCEVCVMLEHPSGHYLVRQQGALGHEDAGVQTFPDRVYKPEAELTERWLKQQKIATQVRVWLNDDNRSGNLNLTKSQIDDEHKQIMEHLRQTQQGSSEREWLDIYIMQELDEMVRRSKDWTGRYYSPYTPSVEALRQYIFIKLVTRYHAPGNMAVTSNSNNLLLGKNPKSILKAIHQLLEAKSQAEVDQALSLVYACMAIRCEIDLNQHFRRVGMHETQYLRQLSDSMFRGELPPNRHIPKAVVLQTRDFQFLGNGELNNRPGWKQPRFEYMLEQIELIADRYAFKDQDRATWLRIETQDNNEEVPFIFSRDSVVQTWTWYDFYEWMANRLQRLNTDCNNHSNARYEDDPALLKRMNVERFTFAMLHIHFYKLDADRKRPRTWQGQGLRALDLAGFECLACLRSPFAPSVAHKAHGKAMLLGYMDLDDEYPSRQDESSFSHEYRNVEIETQLANIGRWTEDTDVQLTMFDQLRHVRIREEDFLPNTPRPYPPGLHIGSLSQVLQDLEAPSLGNDRNFKFGDRFKAFGKLPGGNIDTDDEDTSMRGAEDSMAPVFDATDQLQTIADDVEEDEILELEDARSRSLPVSMLKTPQRSNLGRGKSTCYVSCPLQILHNITSFWVVLRNAKFRMPVDKEILRNDPLGNKHRGFFDAFQSTLGMLTLHAGTGSKVPSLHTQVVRNACTRLTIRPDTQLDKVGVLRGDWEDVNADGGEFLIFLLETLNAVTDTSKCKDSLKCALFELQRERQEHMQKGLSLPKIEEDIDEHRIARMSSGHRSAIDEVHTVQIVEESRCDRMDCMAIERKFEFAPAIQLHITWLNPSTNQPVRLPELRDRLLNEPIDPEGAKKHCQRCEALAKETPGTMQKRLRRIVNEPPVILINIGRLAYNDKTGRNEVKLNQLQDFKDFDLRDWSPRVFSDGENYTAESSRYHLRAVLYYKHSPPHYVTLIQLGNEHQGRWAMFDDLQEQPVFAAPLPLLEPNVCEAMLVYVRNDVPFAQEVQFKSALSVIADLQKAAPDQGGEELAPQGKESIVVGGEEEGIVIQEEGIIVQEEEDWHESHESFPAPKDVSLPQDDDFVDDTEMQAPSEPDEPSSPARLPPWPSSPPLSKDEDHRSLEAAWLELAEAQEAHSQNLKQLALREQRVQQDAGLVAQADQTNRAEAHRLRLYHEDLVRREKAFSQREADLAQRETGFRQRENDLARDDQALSQREDRLDQRQRDLDRQGLLKGAAEATTTEDDLDSLRDILDRVQQGDYLTVSNIIAQHFQNRIFQSMDQSERKRRKPDHESTASSSSALAPLTSPTKPVRALPPLATLGLGASRTSSMFDRTSNPFATPPATASTLGPHTQSTRIPVRTFQQPRTLGQIPSPSRSQSPTKRFNQPSHESSTPMSPSKHKIHRSSAQESVSSTSIQAKSRDQSPSKQTSPSRRPPLFPWWVDSGARVPPMNMSRPGSPVRRGFTTVTSIDVQAAADGVLEYWVERAGAGRRAELRARLVQECPEMVHAAEDRWHEAQLGEGEVD